MAITYASLAIAGSLLIASSLLSSASGAETDNLHASPAQLTVHPQPVHADGTSPASVRIAGSTLWERIASAHEVRVRRLDGQVIAWNVGTLVHTDAPITHTPSLFAGALYPLADERLITLDKHQAEALQQAMSKRRHGGLLDILPECTFEPGVAFCFYGPTRLDGNMFETSTQNEPSVVVVVSFKCDELRVEGPSDPGQAFDIINRGARKSLLTAALAAFPDDAALLEMNRNEK